MALSIQQIRDYAQTGSLAISNAAGEEPARIVRTGIWHALGSRVGWSSSVAQNRNTLAALRDAIQSDPRYFDPDVKRRANELIDGVNVRRSVGVAQIKGIIAALDEMSTPQKQRRTIMTTAASHLASNGLPSEASGFGMNYKKMAQLYAAQDPGKGQTFADIDVQGRLEEFRQIIANARVQLGEDPCSKALFECFANKGAFINGEGKLRSVDEILTAAKNTRELVEGLAACSEKYGNAVVENVIFAVKELGKPVSLEMVKKVLEKGRNLPKADLEKLNSGSSADDIHKAMCGVANVLKNILEQLKGEMQDFKFELDDTFAFQAMQEIASMGVVSSLSSEARRALFDAFKSEQGANLLQFYISHDMGLLQASLVNVMCGMVYVLNREFDHASPGQFIDVPKEINLRQIPIEVNCEIDPGGIGSGTIGKAIIAGLARGVGVRELDEDVGKLSDRFNTITKNTLVVHYAQQFNELCPGAKRGAKTGKPDFGRINTQFINDLMRGHKINVVIRGEKRQLPMPKDGNGKVACDMLTQFITGDENATFEGADTKTKAKVHMLMATAHQGINGVVQIGVSEAFDPKASKGTFNCASDNPDTTITFSLNANNDVETDFSLIMDKEVKLLIDGKSSESPSTMHNLGEGSFVEYKAHITIPKGDMEKFATAKWETYDHAQVANLVRTDGLENRKEVCVNKVPAGFRFTGDVKVYFRMQCEEETVMDVM